MDSNGLNYASVIICKSLNEIILAIHKLDPNKFKQFEDFEGKTLAINIKDPDFRIQLVFQSGIPSFVSDNLETPNTIFQTQWKESISAPYPIGQIFHNARWLPNYPTNRRR